MNSLKIIRSDDLRTENRHRILKTLRQQGSMSRAEIGQSTGLSQAALSTLFGLMSEQGVVTSENQNATVQKRGRPKTTVALDPTAGFAVTVALTIDQLSFCLVNYAGVSINRITQEPNTRTLSVAQLCDHIFSGIKQVLGSNEVETLKTICVGFQGVTDTSSGELLWSPILEMDKVPLGNLLKQEFGVPVTVHNDCGLIATALHHQERDKLGDSFAAVLFSHGIGLGVYLGGVPFTGAYSSALELGHVQYEKNGALCRCGKRGCIEAYASDYGILRTANKLDPNKIPAGPVRNQDIENLIISANSNETQELAAFQLAGKAIGFGLATVFTLLDPLPLALVGHNSDAVNLMRKEIEEALKSVSRNPNDYTKLLHCFQQDTPLMHDGLVVEAMTVLDRLFAEKTDDTLLESSYS